MSCTLAISMPESTWASGMLGVTRTARGSSSSVRVWTASVFIREEPEVATMTGSTTTFSAW